MDTFFEHLTESSPPSHSKGTVFSAVYTLQEEDNFSRDDPPAEAAQRLFRSALGPFAAQGATPQTYALSLRLPAEFDPDWLAIFIATLKKEHTDYKMVFSGGEHRTVSAQASVTIMVQGQRQKETSLKPQEGDRIYRTIIELNQDAQGEPIFPRPALGFGQEVKTIVTGAFSLEKGLPQTLAQLSRKVGMEFYLCENKEPQVTPFNFKSRMLSFVETPWDLLLTVSPESVDDLFLVAEKYNIALELLGHIGFMQNISDLKESRALVFNEGGAR